MTADADKPGRPQWVEAGLFLNENGVTVRELLSEWLSSLVGQAKQVTLAAGYVSFRGLELLAEPLRLLVDSGCRVRLLVGAEPTQHAELVRPASGAAVADAVRRALGETERDLRAELDASPTTGATPWRLDQVRQLIRHPGFECRRWERRFMHAKVIAATGPGRLCRVVAGSFNLSLPGLVTSAELGLSARRADQARAAAAELESWWAQGSEFDLASFIDERLCPYPPELIYLRMLLARFGDEVNAQVSHLHLRPFQRDAVAKALAVIERYGGVLLADEVGLGKTYEAGEVIRRTLIVERGPVLVLCPAHIKHAVWRRRLDEWGLRADICSYTQLIYKVRRLLHSEAQWQHYGLIVLDEAHKLRNPRTKWRWALDELLKQHPRRPAMLLLTATPVQNRGRDLSELLTLASPAPAPDPANPHEEPGLVPRMRHGELEDLCEHADQLDRRSLGRLHAELQRLTVRRTRPFIVQAYARESASLTFPQVQQIPVHYHLPPSVRALFGDTLDAVGVSDWDFGIGQAAILERLRGSQPRVAVLELAAYRSESYRLDGARVPNWLPLLLGLLRGSMLKRLESSVAAFATTAAHMSERTQTALDELDQGRVRVYIPGRIKRQIRDLLDQQITDEDGTELDYDGLVDLHLSGDRPHPGDPALQGRRADFRYQSATLFNVDLMRADLEHDLAVLQHLSRAASDAVPDDPKPVILKGLLKDIAADPRGPKAVLFASARVTTTDLGRRLSGSALRTWPAHYDERIANLGEAEPPSKEHIQKVLSHFAPLTAADLASEIGANLPEDLFDLLLTTDILAEGVNLQQAAFVIHYDLPWNPQLLAQRLGRIDRLGSLHEHVTCYTFLPDIGLDLILGLMDKLMAKTRIAAASVGTPSELFPGAPVEPRDFTDMVEHLGQPTRRKGSLPLEEPQRVWLAQALRRPYLRKALDNLPLWAGAIHPNTFDTPGVVYCFTVLGPHPDSSRTAFARVLGPPHAEAVSLDTARCLKDTHLPLNTWLDTTTADNLNTSADTRIPLTALHMVWNHLDYARQQIAEGHGIPKDQAEERIQLTAWMYLPPHPRLRSPI